MSTFQKADPEVSEIADAIINSQEFHAPLAKHKVKIDYVFAYGDRDDDHVLIGDAITKNGMRVLGVTRKLPLKDRAMGRGDAEITIDHDWWEDATDSEKAALLDHELTHIK